MKLIKKNSRALFIDKDMIWIAAGLTFFAINKNGNRVSKKYHIGSLFMRFICSFRVLRQTFRLGIHHLVILNNQNIFVVIKNKALTIDSKTGEVISCFSNFIGHKPAHQGVCLGKNGEICFCEYSLNKNRESEMSLFVSYDNAISFVKTYTFKKGTVRHIHYIKYDSYADCYWMGTGDSDNESMLLKSYDLKKWDVVGGNSQKWRSIGIVISEDYLYWGTDAGHVLDDNYFIAFNKKTGVLSNIKKLDSPTHGCFSSSGKIYFSTGIEGGKNELTKKAMLFEFKNRNVLEIYSNKKDLLPFFVQYGVIRFPLFKNPVNVLVFTEFGLKYRGETVNIIYEED